MTVARCWQLGAIGVASMTSQDCSRPETSRSRQLQQDMAVPSSQDGDASVITYLRKAKNSETSL